MGEIPEHLQAEVTETLERKDNIKRWPDCCAAKARADKSRWKLVPQQRSRLRGERAAVPTECMICGPEAGGRRLSYMQKRKFSSACFCFLSE